MIYTISGLMGMLYYGETIMRVGMSSQELILQLPQSVYEQVRRAAERSQRPVAELVTEALIAAAPAIASNEGISASLAQLAYLNDAALWQAARSTMSLSQRQSLAALHDKLQRTALNLQEQEDERLLVKLYRETILVRAQAAVLLKQRGYDVRDASQFEPFA
jgi:hypothetical protein